MLVVDRLCIDAGRTRIVDGISFQIAAGERVGLLGASGSGKSLTASAIIGHLPPGITSAGRITVSGHDVAGVPTPRRDVAARPAMIFQNSATALNPMVRVGALLPRSWTEKFSSDSRGAVVCVQEVHSARINGRQR